MAQFLDQLKNVLFLFYVKYLVFQKNCSHNLEAIFFISVKNLENQF